MAQLQVRAVVWRQAQQQQQQQRDSATSFRCGLWCSAYYMPLIYSTAGRPLWARIIRISWRVQVFVNTLPKFSCSRRFSATKLYDDIALSNDFPSRYYRQCLVHINPQNLGRDTNKCCNITCFNSLAVWKQRQWRLLYTARQKNTPLNEISKLLFFQKLPIDLRTFLHTKYSIVYINGIYNPQYWRNSAA